MQSCTSLFVCFFVALQGRLLPVGPRRWLCSVWRILAFQAERLLCHSQCFRFLETKKRA